MERTNNTVEDMLTENPPAEQDFLLSEPVAFRAIDPQWVNKRAAQLTNVGDPGQPNVTGALMEAVQVLYERVGPNAKDDVPAMVFVPEEDSNHPYVVGIPLDYRSAYQRRLDKRSQPSVPVDSYKPSSDSNLQAEFENLLHEDVLLDPKDLAKDERGHYIVQWVAERWKGFLMYQRKLVIVAANKAKPSYGKTLGRYVIGRVATNGVAVFTKAPYRHATKAQAIEEANRLSAEFNSPFGVFRCLDIIDVN